MQEQKPGPNTNPENQSSEPRDWREQRRERREERREKRARDPWRGLFWGLLLILVGVLFFVNQQGTDWDVLWKYLLIGLGAIFIIDGIVHYWSTSSRDGHFGRFIPGIVLLFVGLAFLFNFSQWWPIILIAIGVIILISFVFRRR
jgi:uncharacterized membrane protein HdeD (DUF308 family)